jgi:RNA polymerase sigma-70 factor (ECF subfamily)
MPLPAQQLAELIETQAAALRLWIRSRTSCGDDVVQEAFCRLAVEEPPPANAVAWLYRVCRNLAERDRLSNHRRRVREARTAPTEAQSGAVDPLELAETLAAVEQLEEPLREILVARIWGKLSWEEIGQLSDVAPATAFRRYQAALAALRIKLDANVQAR